MTVRLALVLAAAVWIPAPALAHHAEPLRGQWHLDARSASSTTPDSSGHGLTGTADPFTALVPGRFGSAFRFRASTTFGVQVAPSAHGPLQALPARLGGRRQAQRDVHGRADLSRAVVRRAVLSRAVAPARGGAVGTVAGMPHQRRDERLH